MVKSEWDGEEQKWKTFHKLFLLKPQESDGRKTEKIHSYTMKRIREESLVNQRLSRGLVEENQQM